MGGPPVRRRGAGPVPWTPSGGRRLVAGDLSLLPGPSHAGRHVFISLVNIAFN